MSNAPQAVNQANTDTRVCPEDPSAYRPGTYQQAWFVKSMWGRTMGETV